MDEEATQPATQQVLDPRRLGRNNSGLNEEDISDVLCILHPSSPAAFRIVAATAERSPQHVLQNDGLTTFEEGLDPQQLEEQDTFVLMNELANSAQDLALRLSSRTIETVLGFCFGRNPRSCDIVIDVDSVKRVSNLHFRIYVNQNGVLMLEDMSTNGTLVDNIHLKGKNAASPATRMLVAGSIIQIPSTKPDESIKFIVRIPSRVGYIQEYQQQLEDYMIRVVRAEQRQYDQAAVARGHNGQFARPDPWRQRTTVMAPPQSHQHGMTWDGGDEYNVVGLLGKGAFATVYRLATKLEGRYFAAKELEKKRFIKNGRLDQRLDNEMQIMKSIKHPNIVEYIDYQECPEHLYIIMEFVPCGDLQQYLGTHKTLPEPEAILMSRQVLDALHYLHRKQITHRDIKPDNILIACNEPFTIKLSDFGLSKVVGTDETFLKTFCGTLLYCAPEVFPHYEEHVAKKGQKRRRTGPAPPANFHQYSQSVDIWSYAAVLWLALCGKPPFEGVVDNTGRGMFNKIMETSLDITPLLSRGISSEAIDLLVQMLITDPSQRPGEIDCLNHPWLSDGTGQIAANTRRGLHAIEEEDDRAALAEKEAVAFSQLSLADAEANAHAGAEDFDFDSGEFDFLDPRMSKRVKADFLPRDQIGNQAAVPSSSPNVPFTEDEIDPGGPVRLTPRQPRLFGEIGASALQSSGVLGHHTTAALAIQGQETAPTSADYDMNDDQISDSFQEGQVTSNLFRSDGYGYAATSLLGAEAMVRDLNMESPDSGDSGADSGVSLDAISDAQSIEPKTPDSTANKVENKKPASQQQSSQDITPKQKKPFDRQIRMTIPPALLHDPIDPQMRSAGSVPFLPPTMRASLQRSSDTVSSNRGMLPSVAVAADFSSDPLYPPPRYGMLTSTTDSFQRLRLKIDHHHLTWGRDPKNTHIYPDRLDVRIPKRGVTIIFHALGIEKRIKDGKDWTTMPDLVTYLKTYSKLGVWVNGVWLPALDADGVHLCGRLFTGDVITVFENKDADLGCGPETMRFVCEFYFGEAAGKRQANQSFEVIRAEEPTNS